MTALLWMACAGSVDTGTAPPVSDGSGTAALPGSSLEGPCEAPSTLSQDPLVTPGALETETLTGVKMEHIDVAWGADGATVFATGLGGIMAIDPADQTLIADFLPDDLRGYHDLAVHPDGWIAAASRLVGVHLIDARDPTRMSELSRTATDSVGGFAWHGTTLLVSTLAGELLALALQDDGSLAEQGRLAGFSSPWAIAVHGERAYVADSGLGVGVVSLEDLALVGWTTTAGGPQDLVTDGEHLYVATGTTGVEVLELSDPDHPGSVGRAETGQPVVALSLDGDRLWTAQHAGPAVIDVGTPTAPVVLAADRTQEWALGVAARQDQAWVAAWSRMEPFRFDPALTAPDAAVSTEHLTVTADASLQLWNRGGDTLQVVGGSADGFAAWIEGLEVPPGQAVDILVSPGDADQGTLCLATDDPDEPILEVALSTGSDGLVGAAAPDFLLQDVDGTSWSLSEQLGAPVVLLYFATW